MPIVIGSGNESPGQRARTEMSAEIAGYVLMPDSARARSIAVLAMNDAIRKLNTRPWEWSKTYQDIVLVAGTADYDLTSDFYAPRSLELLNGSSLVIAQGPEFVDPIEFSQVYTDRATSGSPCVYTVFNSHDTGQLTFDRPPDSSYISLYPTVRLRYYRRTPYLAQDSDVIDAPSEVERFIVWHGCWYAATRFDPSKAEEARLAADRSWSDLLRSEQRVLTSDWSH